MEFAGRALAVRLNRLVTADAPLGSLEPGSYVVELYDLDRKQVEMARRVRVP
jgi:hypothetical protein